MSDFGAVPAGILTVVAGAITLGGNRDGFIHYAKIPADQFPFAMIHSPVKQLERGEFEHGIETTANVLVVVWKAAAIATVNTDIALIEAALDGSTLGTPAIVEDTWVSVVGREESVESDFTSGVFNVETRVAV